MMNDFLSPDQPTPDQVEARVVAGALGLLSAFSDPKGTNDRLQRLADATAEHSAQREAAEKALAEARAKLAAAEQADVDLAKRTAAFQAWCDGTEKSYRQRETRILENEDRHAKRNAELDAREADLARRVASHDALLQRLREAAA
jgi:hypothetical protein